MAFFLCILSAHAQKTDPCIAGVFITQDDFINDHLSYKINTAAKDYKLGFTFPADFTLTLKIVTPDSTFKFAPGSIYGFSECGRVYRFYPGGKELNAQEDFYKIEEAGGLILYSSVFVSGDEIFYSTSLTSSIRRLTLRNLKEDFWNYPNFIAKIEKMKRRLADRDENGFLIMDLYEESVSAINK
ncbi:hypothetical protein D4L85_06880 [Chryseolinea soli]|uniref:Uncharacterized protein n=1 Tax=Chryseolinea soli TaxID=2321403 RepID=A0A385SGH6_9BACT|nr:hypothetical protein D4L85_06880 [Chryseolinea soli]